MPAVKLVMMILQNMLTWKNTTDTSEMPSVKFHRRSIVISHAVCPSVHCYQSGASKNYLIFMKFGTRVFNGRKQKPIENQIKTFNIIDHLVFILVN